MLAEYICMDISLCNFKMFGKTAAKTRGIQNCSGTDDLILRKPRNLGKYIGHNINRIAYDDIKRLGSRFYDLRCDLF